MEERKIDCERLGDTNKIVFFFYNRLYSNWPPSGFVYLTKNKIKKIISTYKKHQNSLIYDLLKIFDLK